MLKFLDFFVLLPAIFATASSLGALSIGELTKRLPET